MADLRRGPWATSLCYSGEAGLREKVAWVPVRPRKTVFVCYIIISFLSTVFHQPNITGLDTTEQNGIRIGVADSK